MSTFGVKAIMIKKTRKKHRCELCGRLIPVGSKAWNTGGMFKDCWQNWYMCDFCYDHCSERIDEYVSGEEFSDWLYEQDFYGCPACQCIDPDTGKYCRCNPDWDWSSDHLTIKLECDICGHKWTAYIGFG